MARSVALVVFATLLAAVSAGQQQQQRFPIASSLRVASQQSQELTIKLGDDHLTCADPLKCPGEVKTVTADYGTSGRKGRLTATYLDDGTLKIQTEGITVGSSSEAVLSRTDLLIGDDSPGCRLTASNTVLKFGACGFKQIIRDDVIYREIVIQVYLHLRINQPDLPTPDAPRTPPTLGVCSALFHKLTAEVSEIHNRLQFSLSPENYIPEAVGFQPETCILRPFFKNGSLSLAPEHEIRILENGIFKKDELLKQNITPGRLYRFNTIRHYLSSLVAGSSFLDDKKNPRLECTVCLCSINGNELKRCREKILNGKVPAKMSPFWRVASDLEDVAAPVDTGLEAGPVEVVPGSGFFY
ncbi:hypothetical protein BV898_03296 [Hypsibius exemplaris]|uniref:ZP domain-containing protein n=1 Tax=Hypsibius exemplaris TaxID=2072580 RepID=A0A1W0X655_HYPEX|nr:hypothetical protein BV898_03296 [Hypsibius exemplaris]